jgi:hypothetical protein
MMELIADQIVEGVNVTVVTVLHANINVIISFNVTY